MWQKKIEVYEIKFNKATLYLRTDDTKLTLKQIQESARDNKAVGIKHSVKRVIMTEHKYNGLQSM